MPVREKYGLPRRPPVPAGGKRRPAPREALSGRDAGTSEPGPVDAGGGRDRDSARWTGPPSTQSH